VYVAISGVGAMPAEAMDVVGAFAITAQCGEARAGRLRGGLETPAPLLYTRRGFPAPLTLRELEALSRAVPDSSPAPLGMQISAAELLNEPGAGVLRKVAGGLRRFCGLHDRSDFLLLSARDSLTTQAGMPASEGWTTLQTPAGQKQVTAAEYSELVGAVQPDAALCLTDEVFADSNDKKIKKSVEVSQHTTARVLMVVKIAASARLQRERLEYQDAVQFSADTDTSPFSSNLAGVS